MSPRQRTTSPLARRPALDSPASLQSPSESFKNRGRGTVKTLLLANKLLVLLLGLPGRALQRRSSTRRTTPGPRPPGANASDALGATPRSSTPAWARSCISSVALIGVACRLPDPSLRAQCGESIGLLVGVVASILFGAALGGLTNREVPPGPPPPDRRPARRGAGRARGRAFVSVVVSARCISNPATSMDSSAGSPFAVALDRREEGRARRRFRHRTRRRNDRLAPVRSRSATRPTTRTRTLRFSLPTRSSAAVFIGGIEGVLFSLVPLQFLPGHHVVRWSRVAWVIPRARDGVLVRRRAAPTSDGLPRQVQHRPAVVTYGLFAVFGAASVALLGLVPTPPPTRPHHPKGMSARVRVRSDM